jgi:hypothetical protein
MARDLMKHNWKADVALISELHDEVPLPGLGEPYVGIEGEAAQAISDMYFNGDKTGENEHVEC